MNEANWVSLDGCKMELSVLCLLDTFRTENFTVELYTNMRGVVFRRTLYKYSPEKWEGCFVGK